MDVWAEFQRRFPDIDLLVAYEVFNSQSDLWAMPAREGVAELARRSRKAAEGQRPKTIIDDYGNDTAIVDDGHMQHGLEIEGDPYKEDTDPDATNDSPLRSETYRERKHARRRGY